MATETFCQGLEVDLPIIFFGGDYLIKKDGDHYTRVIDPSDFARKRYGDEIETIMEDTYRILLTRATEEMILVIPQTDDGIFDDLMIHIISLRIWVSKSFNENSHDKGTIHLPW